MDSSMADQLIERFAPLRHAGKLLYGLERIAVRRSDFVLPVCQALADRIAQHAPGKGMHVLHDVAFDSAGPNTGAAVAGLRADLPERTEGHTFELQLSIRRSYAVFCLKKKTNN